jgi:DNA-binding CsgD family transcriptional regulator
MNTQNSAESELLANLSTLWAETERLSKAYQAIMTHIRYKAFATLWGQGKTLREIAEILGIPEGHCAVVQTRARRALGVGAVPYRTMSRKQAKENARSITDHPEMPASELAAMLKVSRTTIYNRRRSG